MKSEYFIMFTQRTINVKKHSWGSLKCQKRVKSDFDNDQYVWEALKNVKNIVERLKLNFLYVEYNLGCFFPVGSFSIYLGLSKRNDVIYGEYAENLYCVSYTCNLFIQS